MRDKHVDDIILHTHIHVHCRLQYYVTLAFGAHSGSPQIIAMTQSYTCTCMYMYIGDPLDRLVSRPHPQKEESKLSGLVFV